MSISDFDRERVREYFETIAPWRTAYSDVTFSYVVIKRAEKFQILQATISLNTGSSNSGGAYFETENVRAGRCPLSQLGMSCEEVVDRLEVGTLSTPQGDLHFEPMQDSNISAAYQPFHPAGLQNQNRLNVLTIFGGESGPLLRQPWIDWELKASAAPFDGVQELLLEYGLGVLRHDRVGVEFIAFNVAVVIYASPVCGEEASPVVHLAKNLDIGKLRLGYRVFSQGKVVVRSSIEGSSMEWNANENFLVGTAKIEIPLSGVLHCIVSYDGVAQQFGWIADPSRFQNSRRTAYEAFDRNLETLRDIFAKAQGRGPDARDLEAAVAWALWMLGFSVAHLGGTRRTQEGPDIVMVAPNGNFAVVECTTGLLKAENKLALLHDRAQSVRRALDASESRHLRVLPVIVTSKTREEIRVDLEQAQRLGILVVTKEDLDQVVTRTLVQPTADQLLDQAFESVRTNQAPFEAQPTLPLATPIQ